MSAPERSIQDAMSVLGGRGALSIENLHQYFAYGSVPPIRPEGGARLGRKIVGGGAISISSLAVSVAGAHADVVHEVSAVQVDTGAGSLLTAERPSSVDISSLDLAADVSPELDTDYRVVHPSEFSKPPSPVDISLKPDTKQQSSLKLAGPASYLSVGAGTPSAASASSLAARTESQPTAQSGDPGETDILGDSIVVMATPAINKAFTEAGMAVKIFAKSGQPLVYAPCDTTPDLVICTKTQDAIREADLHADELADAENVFIQHGRNAPEAIGQPVDPYLEVLDRVAKHVRELTAVDGDPANIFVVNVASGPNDKSPDRAKNRTALLAENADRLGVIPVDWAGLANAHPEFFLSDGVHLNEAGSAALADLIKQAVLNSLTAPASSNDSVASSPSEVPVQTPAVETKVQLDDLAISDLSLVQPPPVDISTNTSGSADKAQLVRASDDSDQDAPSGSSTRQNASDAPGPVKISRTGTPASVLDAPQIDEDAPVDPTFKNAVSALPGPAYLAGGAATPPESPAAAPAPPAEVAPAHIMTPEELAEQIGLTGIDNYILQQYQAGGDIELGPVADYYLAHPELAEPMDGMLVMPSPIATAMDRYTFHPGTCLSERRVYPEQAALFKGMSVIYNFETQNNPLFAALPPSELQGGDGTAKKTHTEHKPETPAIDVRTVLVGVDPDLSNPRADDGPAFEPGGDVVLNELMVRTEDRFVYHGRKLVEYSIHGNHEVAAAVADLRRPNGRPFFLDYDDHPEHNHLRTYLMGEVVDIPSEPSSGPNCADGAPLTTDQEVLDFTNQLIASLTPDAPEPAPAPAPPEQPANVQQPKQPILDEDSPGKVDISTGRGGSPGGNVVTDPDAPVTDSPEPAPTPPATPNQTPVVTPPEVTNPGAADTTPDTEPVLAQHLAPDFEAQINTLPISDARKHFLIIAAQATDIALASMQHGEVINEPDMLAMMVNESNWGESRLAIKGNNYLGMKSGKAYTGPTVPVKDDEFDANGNLIPSNFIDYSNPELLPEPRPFVPEVSDPEIQAMLPNLVAHIMQMNSRAWYQDMVQCAADADAALRAMIDHIADDCVTVLATREDTTNPYHEPAYATAANYIEVTARVRDDNNMLELFAA